MNKIFQANRNIVTPDFVKQSQDMQRIQKRLQSQALSISRAMEPIVHTLRQFDAGIKALQQQSDAILAPLQRLSSQYKEQIERFADAFQRLPEEYRRSLGILADHGWYIHPDMPFDAPMKLAKRFEQGNMEEVENSMESYFQQKCAEIRDSLSCCYSTRESIFRDAFYAHDQEQYNLCVPIFIIQTDGIFFDRFRQSLYIPNQRASAIERHFPKTDLLFQGFTHEFLRERRHCGCPSQNGVRHSKG